MDFMCASLFSQLITSFKLKDLVALLQNNPDITYYHEQWLDSSVIKVFNNKLNLGFTHYLGANDERWLHSNREKLGDILSNSEQVPSYQQTPNIEPYTTSKYNKLDSIQYQIPRLLSSPYIKHYKKYLDRGL